MFESILLVDDHAAILAGLQSIVTARYAGATCRTASSADDARRILAHQQPQLAILDVSIGESSGLDLIRVVLERAPNARILVYTMHPENEFGLAALRAGAHGYVTKDRPLSELTMALASLEAGERYISNGLAESIATAMSPDQPRNLSGRETQILKMLAAGRAPKEIAADLGVSVKTVSTYRARILEKLRLSTTADLIRYAVNKGI